MKFNGVELMKDTASLTNALLNSGKRPILVGMGVAELMWTDRKLMQVTAVIDDRTFAARDVEVKMECWQDGTQYPVKNPDGSLVLQGKERIFKWSNRGHGSWRENGRKVNINIGATTGYCDPSF